jgi:hypothetical protein
VRETLGAREGEGDSWVSIFWVDSLILGFSSLVFLVWGVLGVELFGVNFGGIIFAILVS